MTREAEWHVTGTTRAILLQLESLGYLVSVFRMPPSLLGAPEYVEMHAFTDTEQHIAKSTEIGEIGELKVACALATSCGIDLEG